MVATEVALLSGLGKAAEKAVPNRGMIGVAALGIASVGGGLKAFANVPTGHFGIRTRFDKGERVKGKKNGEHYGSVGPGMHWTVPFSDAIKIISVQHHNHELGQIVDEFPDNDGTLVQREIDASITWSIINDEENVYRALFEPESPEALTRIVADISTSGLRRVLKSQPGATTFENEVLYEQVKESTTERLGHYGVQLLALQLKAAGFTLAHSIQQINSPIIQK